jgi:hypothetical protein
MPGAERRGRTSNAADRPAGFRYGAVLLLTLVLLLFLIVAPSASWSRAVALGLEGAALVVVAITSRGRPEVRRSRAIAVGAGTAVCLVGIAVGAVPAGVAAMLLVLVIAAILYALVGGLGQLVQTHGVTAQAVAGALTIYLLIGLVFAWTITFIAYASSTPYFAQHTDGSSGERVYFSFTALTTTGFGDLSAGTSLARAMTVLEMLVGQIYLVTVIGVLVGHFVGNRQRGDR